jgi:hypothetical protein
MCARIVGLRTSVMIRYWESPDEYRPERWMDPNKSHMTGEGAYFGCGVEPETYTFLPFFTGSRSAAIVQSHLAASDSSVKKLHRGISGTVGDKEYPKTHVAQTYLYSRTYWGRRSR